MLKKKLQRKNSLPPPKTMNMHLMKTHRSIFKKNKTKIKNKKKIKIAGNLRNTTKRRKETKI